MPEAAPDWASLFAEKGGKKHTRWVFFHLQSSECSTHTNPSNWRLKLTGELNELFNREQSLMNQSWRADLGSSHFLTIRRAQMESVSCSFPLQHPQTPTHSTNPSHALPPHPVSKLGHASQPTAHTFLSSSSFWTLIHLWSDSVLLALQGIQDYCTYRAVASRRARRGGGWGWGCRQGSGKWGG